MKFKANNIPDWLKRGSVYQINPRTFSKDGTIKAVTEQLPFLAELGFSIMYLCPIFEEDASEDRKNWSKRQIASGTENPKNPYRMNDYFKIDSEYGTLDDLREFVSEAHRLNMHVLLDLVYYHIGPNAPILKEHPEFVKLDNDGNAVSGYWNFPVWDYNCEGLREYLYCNMLYYVAHIGVDGFRCDVGDMVPLDFWREGLRRMKAVNPEAVLINEGADYDYLTVFNSEYAYYWHDCIYKVISGEAKACELREKWTESFEKLPSGAVLLRDIDNHDTVTDWKERVEKTVGHSGMEMLQALNYIIDGIPMVYCGNELGDTAHLSMFANRFHMGEFEATDRSIASKPYSIRRQYVFKALNGIKSQSDTLANGVTIWLSTDKPDDIVAFVRKSENEDICFIGSFSGEVITCKANDIALENGKIILECANKINFENGELTLPPFGYAVFKIEK